MPRKPIEITVVNEIEGKPCGRCKDWRPLAEFNKDRTRLTGLSIRCKLCESEVRREYRRDNRKKELERHRRYYHRHKNVCAHSE